MKVYNKLVRDRIPEIIKQDGKKPVTTKLSVREFKSALRKKLVEEAKEALEASRRDQLALELADVTEVLETLAKAYKISTNHLGRLQQKRRKERGGFKKRLLLKRIT